MSTFSMDSEAWIGSTVIDADNRKVGTVEAIYVDEQTGSAEGMAVKSGLLGTTHRFVPLADAMSTAGAIKTPYAKSQISDGPTIDPDEDLGDDQVRELYRYYQLAYEQPSAGAAVVDGCDVPDNSDHVTVATDLGAAADTDFLRRGEQDMGTATTDRESDSASQRTPPSASSPQGAVAGAQRGGERVAHRREFKWLARAGLIARGVSYGIVGILALQLAFGAGDKASTQRGALLTIAEQPFGRTLLIAMVIGLASYAIWRLVRAAIGHGTQDADNAGERIAGAASGLAYIALSVTAVKILIGANSGGGTSSPKRTTGGILDWTGGTTIIACIGAILIGVALYQGYKGLSKKFLEDSNTAEMSRKVQRAFTTIGVFGHLARMVVFGLIGYGLIKAAVDYDPRNAVGLDGALSQLADLSYGPLLLGVVAVGLIGFALYSIADARYRKI